MYNFKLNFETGSGKVSVNRNNFTFVEIGRNVTLEYLQREMKG